MSNEKEGEGIAFLLKCSGIIMGIYQLFAVYQCMKYVYEYGTFWATIGAVGGGNIPFLGAIWAYMGAVKGWGMPSFLALLLTAISFFISGISLYNKWKFKKALKAAEEAKKAKDTDK